MSKQIAILSYDMIFDPSESWSSGYQFEKLFGDFFSYYGFDAAIVETAGGTGRRVIHITRANAIPIPKPTQQKEGKPASEQIKQVQQQRPTSSFKEYQERGVPKSFVNQEKRQPKPTLGPPGRSNRMKVRTSNG